MELQLHAVQVTLEDIRLPVDPADKQYIPQRLIKLHLCQNVIDSILSLQHQINLTDSLRFSNSLCSVFNGGLYL